MLEGGERRGGRGDGGKERVRAEESEGGRERGWEVEGVRGTERKGRERKGVNQ